MAEIERYHDSVVDAHRQHRPVATPLPEPPAASQAGVVAAQAELSTSELALGSGLPMSAPEDE